MARPGHGTGKMLTEERMARIYQDHLNGISRGFLQEKYGLSKASISKAIREMRQRGHEKGKG